MSVLVTIPDDAAAEIAARAIFRSELGAAFLAWLMEHAGVLAVQSATDQLNRLDPLEVVANEAQRRLALKIVEMSGVKLQLGWLGLPDAPATRQKQARSPLEQESHDG